MTTDKSKSTNNAEQKTHVETDNERENCLKQIERETDTEVEALRHTAKDG